jgi:hypothetical protein
LPGACPFCDGVRIWLDGWRLVFCVVLLDGTPHRFDDGLPLQRVVCAGCHVSWTLRPAFLYPHRSFEPDVVEAAGFDYLGDPAANYEQTATVAAQVRMRSRRSPEIQGKAGILPAAGGVPRIQRAPRLPRLG